MNFFDLIILIPLVFGLYKGFSNGFIVELATLVALILGVYGAIGFSGYTKEKIEHMLDIETEYLSIIAFIITFIIIVVLVYLLAQLLTGIAKLTPLHILNKIFGGVFGLLRVAFFLSVLFFIFSAFDKNEVFISRDTKEESIFYNPIYSLSEVILPSINSLKEKESFKEFIDEANKVIELGN
jgi:membrane protein required for colicin V production